MVVLYICFIPVGNRQHRITVRLGLGSEPGTNDRELNALSNALAGLIFNASSNVNAV